ncbi:hypothetical protein EDB89DRAFT_748583 [Lactarius sanguifluus]|nr:hypothetical protein EDB89DRAFT_748583 [Lactarius sanguifluus]
MAISPLRSALRMWKHSASPVEKNLVFYNHTTSQNALGQVIDYTVCNQAAGGGLGLPLNQAAGGSSVSPRRTPSTPQRNLYHPRTDSHQRGLTIVVQFSRLIGGKTKVPILSISNAASLPRYLLGNAQTCLWVATQEGARGRHRQPQGNQKRMGYPRRLRIYYTHQRQLELFLRRRVHHLSCATSLRRRAGDPLEAARHHPTRGATQRWRLARTGRRARIRSSRSGASTATCFQ